MQVVNSRWQILRQRLAQLPPLDAYRYRYAFSVVTALIAAIFLLGSLNVLHYYPLGWQILLIIVAAGLWAVNPRQGQLLAVCLLILPIAYTYNYTGGGLGIIASLLVAFAGMLFPFTFLMLALATLCFANHALLPLLFVIPLALGFMTPARAAFQAGLTTFFLELLMIQGGVRTLGPLTLGASATTRVPVLYHAPPARVATLTDFTWLDVKGDPGAAATKMLQQTFTPFIDRPALLAQIVLWAVAAAVVSVLMQRPLTRAVPRAVLAVGLGAVILLAGHIVLNLVLVGTSVDVVAYILLTLISVLVTVVASPLLEVAPIALMPHEYLGSSSGGGSPLERMNGNALAAKESFRKEIPKDTWDDLAGIDSIRAEIQEAILSQFDARTRENERKLGLEPTRGILLFGPPGTGKTRIARVIAHEAKATFIAVSGTEFTSKWFGESEANLRRIFDQARQNRPCVLFFDELEAFLPKRSEMSRADAPEKGIIGTFLSYTSGLGDADEILLVGATNYPDLIDPAAIRSGRFDKMIYVSAPDREGRRAIIGRFMANRTLAPDCDLEKVAAKTERYTGADLQSLCTEVTRMAINRGKDGKPDPITLADFETVIAGIKPTVTLKMQRQYEELNDQFGRRAARADRVDVVERPTLSWNQVAGLDGVKAALHDAIEMPLLHPDLLKELGAKPSKGVLLFGPPGCGKTFLAKVVASEAKAHFLQVKGPELLQQYVGASESALRDIFIRARENAPCVLFFDEIDAIASARGTAESRGTQMVTQFLTEMDGFEELNGVIVVGATNRPDMLDEALMRPGRFDRILYIPPPDFPARVALLRLEMANRLAADDIDYDAVASKLQNYSSADITAICNAAALATARRAIASGVREPITQTMLEEQIKRTAPSISPESLQAFDQLRVRYER